MSLLLHKKLRPEGELGLWQIEEAEDWFLQQLQLRRREYQQLELLKGHRRLEWLAGRLLLHRMSGRRLRGACLKDEFGKPYLSDSLFEISISHSRDLAAVIAAPRAVGIDIQKVVEKIERIAHKFMRDEEMDSLRENTRLEHLHVYWGAKEALYKAYGRRQLDFREHIFIDPFDFSTKGGTCTGYVSKDGFLQFFAMEYEIIMEHYVLVWGMEDIGDVRLV